MDDAEAVRLGERAGDRLEHFERDRQRQRALFANALVQVPPPTHSAT